MSISIHSASEVSVAGTGEPAKVERDYRRLTRAAGLRLAGERLVVLMTGIDRVAFMQGMCSNDIKGLELGGVLYALLMTEHAHVLADFYALAREGELLLEFDRALWPRARRHLEKFLVADDVEIEELEDRALIQIEGPQAARLAAVVDKRAESLPLWQSASKGEIVLAHFPRLGRPGFTVIADSARTGEIFTQLAGAESQAAEVGPAALEILRVESGLAKVGVDTGEKTIALEARLQSAISFNKGCYLGQETIERATARGALRKRLFGLRLSGARLPPAGAAVKLAGKEVGRVTSAALSPRLGALGLSMLHRSAWTPGLGVTVDGAGGEIAATVSDLPFG